MNKFKRKIFYSLFISALATGIFPFFVFATTPDSPDIAAASVPGGLTARAITCSQISLHWSASTDTGGSRLRGYNVYRNGSYLKQVLAPLTWTSDKGLAASTVYSYAVSAIDNAGNESAKSSATSATTPTPPSVPTGLTADPIRFSQIHLSWAASTDTGGSGLKGYNVYRNGRYVKRVLAPSTSATDTGLAASTSYSYAVSAIDNSGNEGTKSSAASATTPTPPDITAPSVPAGLTASPISFSQIYLSWAASTDTGGSGLKGYKVYRNGRYVKRVLAPSTSATDKGLAASTSYSYAVSAIDNAGNESAGSTAASATTPPRPDITVPSVPRGLAARAINCSQIDLSWNASSDTGGSGLKGYNVYRNGSYLKQVLTTSTSDTGLAASTNYSYSVSAIDNSGNESTKSIAVSATTPASPPDTTAPSVPAGLSAAAISCSQIYLSWGTSTDTGGSGLKGYNIYRNGSYLKQVLTTSTSDTGLAASTNYSYSMSAIDNSGNESAKSSATSATTPACPDNTAPSVPAGLSASASSCSQINLSWGASTDTGGSGLKGYNIYRNGLYLKQVLTTSTSDTGLAGSTVYSYSVSAIDNSGNESTKSSTKSATTPACPDASAPSVPAGLTASASSCSQINLSWGASTDTGGSGLKGYNIYRNGLYLKQVLTTSTSDTGLAGSTVYSYSVSAIDNSGNESTKSSTKSATTPACPDASAPSVPAGLTASASSCSQINLSWGASTDTGGSGLKGYNIYRNGSYLKQVLTTSTSDTGLAGSTVYSYSVSAIDNSGNESTKSTAKSATTPACPDTSAPSVPAGLTASATSCSQINLSWGASTDTGGSGLKGYNLYRNGSYLKQVLTTSATDTGLGASTVYSYSVSAIDNSGNESTKSSAASATTPACPDTTAPSVPAGLSASATSCSQINLSWGASTDTGGSGLKGYNVYRNGSYLKQVLTTSTSDTGLAASTVYSYAVSAIDNSGNGSAKSNTAATNTPSCPDVTPPSVSITNPPSGTTYTTAQTVRITATASDNVGVTKVEFYDGSKLMGTATASPYTYSWAFTSADNGTHNWTAKAYDGAGNTAISSAVAIMVNEGATSSSWDKQIGNTWNDDSGKVVACRNGDVLVIGGFRISYDFGGRTRTPVSGEDGFLVRYSSGGTYLWDKQLGGTGEDLARSVIETSDGNIIVAGDFYNTLNLGGGNMVGYSSSGKDFFVVKYSSNGSFIWQKHFSCATGAYVRGLAPDHDGGFYMIGSIYGGDLGDGRSSNGTFLARYDSNGNYIWIRTFQTESGSTLPRSVAKLSTNEVVMMVSYYYGMNMGGGMLYPYKNGRFTTYLGKYSSSDGSHIWSERFTGRSDPDDNGQVNGWAVAGIDNGGIALVGGMSKTVDLGGGYITSLDATDAFVACYDNNGTYIWANHYGYYGANSSNLFADVTYTGSGSVVVTGYFSTPIDFGAGTYYGTSVQNGIVAEYSTSSGTHQWSDWWGEVQQGTMRVVPSGVAVTSGLAVVTGTFDSGTHPIDFGSGQRTSLGGTDIFVVADPMTW